MASDARASGPAALLVCLSAMLAITCSTFVCVLVQAVVPTGHGPEYALFPYDGELVAIDLVGGVVPLLASLSMLAPATGPRRNERPAPFRSPAYWLAVLVVALFLTLFFSASHALYGGLGLSKLWAYWLVVAGGMAGVSYWLLRGRRLGAAWGTAECYVMGTLAVFASDLIRTLGGLATVPGESAVWGGGGLLDILFWFGLYVSLSFLMLRFLLALLTSAYGAILRAGAPAGWADRPLPEKV